MYIGIDIGTTGCKAVLFGGDGVQRTSAYREYSHGGSGYELSGTEISDAVFEVAATAGAGADVTAIAVTSCGEAFVLLGENGLPLMSSILYSDSRGEVELNRLVERVGADYIVSHCGVMPHIMYSAAKLAWLAENSPEIFSQAKCVLQYGEYAGYLLTGERFTDYALASRTMLFDIHTHNWDPRLTDALGLDPAKLSTPVPTGTAVSHLSREAAARLGMPESVRVICGSHDQICAAIGAGVFLEGDAVLGMGTVECITPIYNSTAVSDELSRDNYAVVPFPGSDLYTTYAFGFCGGAMLRWYRDTFKPERAADPGIYRELDAAVSGGPGELMVLPHMSGSATPDMNTRLRGIIAGLTLDSTDTDIYRAVMEGVTYESLYNLRTLGSHGISPKRLIAAGGGSRSGVWLQMKADAFDIPIYTTSVAEAGAAGCAMLCAVADGSCSDLADAAKQFVKLKDRVYLPDASRSSAYAEHYSRYLALRELSSRFYS